ncbi:hypothetical protein niasHT_038144 [Heterodera trifolii]|uniref:G_PROTEIN_RECEP_F1_2 domain-containing protein n=1 Tax=Heterodera trifolii TaxID=157864 RepID=A0ABD2I690_9BILA
MLIRTLHSHCNILIALSAFSDIFLLGGLCVKFFIFLFGINYITLEHCYYIQFVSLSASTFALTIQLCIGLDRLAGVAFPIWYKINGKYTVFKILIGICLIKVIVDKCVQFYANSKHWETLVRCELADPANQPEIINYTRNNTMVINVAELLFYVMIWLITWCRDAQIFSEDHGKRLLLSLSLIMAINVFFYIGNGILVMFILALGWISLSAFTTTHIYVPICFILFSIGHHCSSAPILFICSLEYRCAFRATFWPRNVVTTVQHISQRQNIVTNIRSVANS